MTPLSLLRASRDRFAEYVLENCKGWEDSPSKHIEECIKNPSEFSAGFFVRPGVASPFDIENAKKFIELCHQVREAERREFYSLTNKANRMFHQMT